LQRLIDAVSQAAQRKGQVERLADRLSAWFLPAVIVIAALTFLGHLLTRPVDQALMPALAVLLIACPCALGLATPMALWAAMGRASREQVMFRDADALIRLAKVSAICFDKTGTLTTGTVEFSELVSDHETDAKELTRRASILCSTSNHHLARAIAPLDIVDDVESHVSEARSLPGRGIVGCIGDGHDMTYLGSERFMSESGLQQSSVIAQAAERLRRGGLSLAFVGWSGVVRGVFAFRETLRDEASSTLEELRQDGFRLAVLTGDHGRRAEMLGAELHVPVESELLPEDKLAFVDRIRGETGLVAMVGDGINDAPALSAADVGIALGCGADVSRDAADVCLLSNDLRKISWTIRLARRTKRTVRENLIWAFAYNSVGIVLAAFGLLSPIIAAIAMVGSSLYVVSNSLRLAGRSEQDDGRKAAESQRKVAGDLMDDVNDVSTENELAQTGVMIHD
jgi:heavy metal translocating P-type ATPase